MNLPAVQPPTIITGPPASDRTAALLTRSPLADHRSSADDRRVLVEADRRGLPYLVYRDHAAAQRLVVLDRRRGAMTLGRSESADVPLHWDRGVSREHAELVLGADGWAVVDGESLNGTFVNRERVRGRRRLRDRDLIQIGEVAIAFRDPSGAGGR